MPRKRKAGTSAYQFEMPDETHKEGADKSKKYGFNLAALMRMHYQEFIDRPIEDSMAMLRAFLDKQPPSPSPPTTKRKEAKKRDR
jgi:hypothetical protein